MDQDVVDASVGGRQAVEVSGRQRVLIVGFIRRTALLLDIALLRKDHAGAQHRHAEHYQSQKNKFSDRVWVEMKVSQGAIAKRDHQAEYKRSDPVAHQIAIWAGFD